MEFILHKMPNNKDAGGALKKYDGVKGCVGRDGLIRRELQQWRSLWCVCMQLEQHGCQLELEHWRLPSIFIRVLRYAGNFVMPDTFLTSWSNVPHKKPASKNSYEFGTSVRDKNRIFDKRKDV